MSKKMKLSEYIILALLFLFSGFCTYFGYEKLLSGLSTQSMPNELLGLPFLLLAIEIVILLVKTYAFFQSDDYLKSLKSLSSAALSCFILSTISLIICIILGAVVFKGNFVYGQISIAYPLDFLLVHLFIAICCLGLYIYFIKQVKEAKSTNDVISETANNSTKPQYFSIILKAFFNILKYVLLFLAMIFFGTALFFPTTSFDDRTFYILWPVYLEFLVPVAAYILYIVFSSLENNKKTNIWRLITFTTLFIFSLSVLIYSSYMMFNNINDYVSMTCSIFSLDALISKPISHYLLFIVSLLVTGFGLYQSIIKFIQTNKETK